MGPENSRKKPMFYMMMDGQPVAVEPDFAEITFAEDQQGNTVMDNCEFSMRVKLPHSLRCRSRKRFVKLLMASGYSRDAAHAFLLPVRWRNRQGVPEYLKTSYQGYFIGLWMRGLVNPAQKRGR